MSDEIAPAPPPSLKARGDVDGWSVDLPTPDRLLASRITLLLVMATIATGGAAMFAGIAASSLFALAGGVALTAVLGGMAWLVIRRARPVQVQIGATHLQVTRGSSRTRVAWEALAPPRHVADARDSWLQSFDASLETTEASAPLPASKAVPAVGLRWTADGRPAAHAHERTDWESLVLGAGRSREELDWLHDAIYRAQTAHAERSRQTAFDELAAGRPGERARAALTDLVRDRGEG